jgi:hypothetical protein
MSGNIARLVLPHRFMCDLNYLVDAKKHVPRLEAELDDE